MNDTLIYGLATMGVTFLAVVVRYGFKSKCSEVGLCFGMLSIKRDTNAEIRAEEKELEMGIGRQDSSKI